MSDILFAKYSQKIIDCDSEFSLASISEEINGIKNRLDMRDFVIIQNLIFSKGNELAISNIMQMIELIEVEYVDDPNTPPMGERH